MFILIYLFCFRVNIIANCVKLDNRGQDIYEYQVTFEPFVDSENIRIELVNQHREVLGSSQTFDGVTLYLPYMLNNMVRLFVVMLHNNLVYHFSLLYRTLR